MAARFAARIRLPRPENFHVAVSTCPCPAPPLKARGLCSYGHSRTPLRFPCVTDTADRDVYPTAVRPRYGFFAKHHNEIVKEYLQESVTCVSSTDEEWLLSALCSR
jgi:hypothetical protein